jgi:hypothetical protein
MPALFVDNFDETLTVAVSTTGQVLVDLPSGTGAKLSGLSLSTTNYLPLFLTNGTTVEIVHATARTTDQLTVVRAQGGTTAATFAVGSKITCGPVAHIMQKFADATEPISLTAQTTALTASSGFLKMQARTKAGITRLETMALAGVEVALQSSLFSNRVMIWKPGSGTAMTYFGLTGTVSATASHPTPATGTLAQSMYRTRFACSTTAGNSAGIRDNVNTIWRGDAAGRGGFLNVFMFCSGDINLSGGQQICGLTSQTTTLAGEPSALPNVLAMLKDSGDTNWQFARRTGTGTVQKVSLGVAPANNQTFEIEINCAPNGSSIFVRIVQWNFDGTNTVLLDTSYSTDIPASTTLLGFMCHTRNGSTAAANNIELVGRYTFSGF